MIYYICKTPDGIKLETSQTNAIKLDKTPEKVDVPVDKTGLQEWLEPLLNRLTHLEGIIEKPPLPVVQTKPKEPEEKGPYWPYNNYTDFSCFIDESFRKLSINHQVLLLGWTLEAIHEAYPPPISIK